MKASNRPPNCSTLSQRLRSIQRRPLNADGTRGRQRCVETTLAQKLEIAALYANTGDNANTQACALLALFDLQDNPGNRTALLASIDDVAAVVRQAVQRRH